MIARWRRMRKKHLPSWAPNQMRDFTHLFLMYTFALPQFC